jgi:hypothetical protein
MKDLSFLSPVEGAVVEMPLAIQGVVDGRAALAQRVITMILANPEDPARTFSTGILQAVGQSNVRNATDLENDFTLATKQVRTIIATEQELRTDLTEDETLSDVTAENIRVEGDKVYADIVIVTVSGEDLKVSLEI